MRAVALAALAAAGCYAPSAKNDSYQCSSTGACPQGLTCGPCGMCVAPGDTWGCGFAIDVDPNDPCFQTAFGPGCYTVEGRAVHVTVTALAKGHTEREMPRVASNYAGSAELGSTWGHARNVDGGGNDVPVTFVNGVADLHLAFDRATPGNTAAVISVRAGSGYGESVKSVVIDPIPIAAEPAPVIAPPFGWATGDVGDAAIDKAPDGKLTLYFAGLASGLGQQSAIGAATSSDGGRTWTPLAQPVIAPPKTAEGYMLLSPSVLRDSGGMMHLFWAAVPSNRNLPATSVVKFASSSDGMNFDPPMDALSAERCAKLPNICDPRVGFRYPWAMTDPTVPSQWRLYFSKLGAPPGMMMNTDPSSTLGVARSGDLGMTWELDPVPNPARGGYTDLPVFGARVVYDAKAGLYRMWYAEVIDAPFFVNICRTVIAYATSTDGFFWTGSRPVVKQLAPADVPWANKADGLLPSYVDVDTSGPWPQYKVWFSAIANVLLLAPSIICAPVGIGRANPS